MQRVWPERPGAERRERGAMTDEERGETGPADDGDEQPLLSQICDIVRYAPIAILLDGPSMLPKLAQQGKVHMGNARYLGRRAVREAEPQVRRLLEGLGGQAGELLKGFGLVPPGPPPEAAPTRPPRSRQVVTTEVVATHGNGDGPVASTSAPAPVGPAVDDLAIPDYDSLSASHVVNRLPGLSPDELEAVRLYEAAHRGRKTILNKAAQLQQPQA